ncbi:maleylpyruvate isomerase family mycothiol-dependent enzyme [Kitasatospora sp. NPDC056181]|uniref:maleylpyruvate isomerase family mycothiol-dependent enzyme n=1 Tax=Kitasatospora sp. NPDC056181 TaxID=3345737 RepID=UPI0035E11CD7
MIPAPVPRDSVHTALLDAVLGVAEDIAALLRDRPDTGRPIPGAQWTVGEAAAHLALANELMAALAAGEQRTYGDGTPDSLAAANAASLAAFPERDATVLAEEIVRHARAFTEACAERPASAPVVTPLGPMDLATLASYLLTHMLGHGYDLAVALRRPHMVDRDRVGLTLPFLTTAMPWVVDARSAAGHTARYGLRVRGGARFTVTFRDGVAEVSPGLADRLDCTILTEPVTFLLLALGRCNPTAVLARGKVLAWGRKPWLALGFPLLFKAP